MRQVVAIDATGLQAVETVHARLKREGAVLLISGIRAQPREAMERSGLLKRIGAENVHPVFPEALAHARKLVGAVQTSE